MKPSRLLLALVPLAAFIVAGCTSTQVRQNEAAAVAQDPSAVAVIAGEPLTVDEFERRYVRAVGSRDSAVQDSMAAYQDFLERYVNYRVKVMAAKEAGYDQDSTVRAEIAQYRQNLSRPYLLEEAVIEPIVRDLYEKSLTMVDASHILLRVPPTASPTDTLEAYTDLAELRDSLMAGDAATLTERFGDAAEAISEDPSAARDQGRGYRGRLGYFSAGRLVEPFEETAWTIDENVISEPVRTRFGYHLILVHDRLATPQDRRVSHIMLRPTGPTEAAKDSALALGAAIIDSLNQGVAFDELARRHSADAGSAARGGDLGFVEYGSQLPETFRDAAFALEAPGDVTQEPVETRFGYHVILFDEERPQPTFEEQYDELKEQAQRLPRMARAETQFGRQVLRERGARVDSSAIAAVFGSLPADSVATVFVGERLQPEMAAMTFATLGDSTYTLGQLQQYAQQNPVRGETGLGVVYETANNFLTEAAVTYEAMALEETNEEFGAIMAEFRDGLMLFNLMEDSVWTAAAQDTSALETYFEANQAAYRFPDRTRIVAIYGTTEDTLRALGARLDAGLALSTLLDEVAQDTTGALRADTLRLAGPSDSVFDEALELEPGERTAPRRNRRGYVLMINDGMEPARAKTFEEAQAEVAAAYQDVLEERVVSRLRERYDVETYPSRLTDAFDGESRAPAASAEVEPAADVVDSE